MTRVDELIRQRDEGRTLQQEFYRDGEIFERDVSRIHLRHWLCVGHASRIPDRGDYFVHDLAGESFIIVRGGDGEIRAFANVCRHRGSQICYEKEGSARAFVCPYHAWSYALDGSLRSARHSHRDFDKSQYGLNRLHVQTIEGLIFICCADKPPDLGEATRVLGASLRNYGWANAKVAHRACYSVEANWKLTTENYLECYHCAPAHPEFSRFHTTAKPLEETRELRDECRLRARSMGIEIPDVDHWPVSDVAGGEGISCFHDAAVPGSVTGSEDGQAVAPLMGNFSDYDGGFTYMEVGPASFFLAYPDYGMVYLFIPVSAERTDMEISWLVRDDAREGEDYDIARLTWMWDVTSIADKRIIDHNQKGVNSRFYRPGPYLEMEYSAGAFVDWYLKEIRDDA